MIGIPLGLIYANAGEWVIHKYLLHGKNHGKKRGSTWSFHFYEHHRNCRTNDMTDPDYERSPFKLHAQGKELLGLVAIAAVHAPLFPVAPFLVGTVWYSAVDYYRVHKRAHQDPEWARQNLPWHYDHHMGPDQDANWGVTHDWCDRVMGTRIPYVGTQREREDLARRDAAKASRAAEPEPQKVAA